MKLRHGRSRAAAGVTLMEMLVVAAIVSILLAVVFPSVGSGLGTLELHAAATRLVSASRYARDQAVFRQRTFQLEIDARRGAISVEELSGENRRRYELPNSIRIVAVRPGDGNLETEVHRFFFLPDGSAPAFEVVLASDRRQILVASDALTGTARIEE